MIDPKEVIAKYTVEEICAGAEHYFSSITDTRFQEKKPLSSPEEASELFYEVGLLLRGLRLGPSMRVRDRWWSIKRWCLARSLLKAMRRTMGGRTVFFLAKGSVGLDSRTREGLAGSLELVGGALKGRVGQPLKVDLSVTNVGDATWLAEGEDGIGVVYLGVHRSGRDGNLIDRDIARARVPRAVGPGETIEMSLILDPPDRGVGRLDLDLVSEKITWFAASGDRRHRTVSISVEIE